MRDLTYPSTAANEILRLQLLTCIVTLNPKPLHTVVRKCREMTWSADTTDQQRETLATIIDTTQRMIKIIEEKLHERETPAAT